jgi:hypothetical protein
MLRIIRSKKTAKLQWVHDPSEINGDNLNNVRLEASRQREYLNDKINELSMNSKNKNIRDPYRGINIFKRGMQIPMTFLIGRRVTFLNY